jgi:FAD binding domain
MTREESRKYNSRDNLCAAADMMISSNCDIQFILCNDNGDVQQALRFVTQHEMSVSIRSGGHSACGSSIKEGSVVIDLANINHLHYDETTQTITFGPGCTLSDIGIALSRQNRMTPIGVVSVTGVGGLVAHGGIGWLMHKYGLSVDQVTRMTMILADGTIKVLGDNNNTAEEDHELFHAARGCAGNLGIITSFTMMTYPLETITGGLWFMLDDDRYTNTRALMRLGRDIVLQQEKESSQQRTLVGGMYMMTVPPEATIPVEYHNKPCTGVWMGAWGDSADSQALVNQFVNRQIVLGKPPAPMPFSIFNHLLCGPFLASPPMATYWKGAFVKELPNETLDALCDEWCGHEPWLNASIVGLDLIGGRRGQEHAKKLLQQDDDDDNDHCVAGLRDFLFSIPILLCFPPQQDEEMLAKAKTLARSMAQIFEETKSTTYSNYNSDMGVGEEKKTHEGLMIENQARIDVVKARVDPHNLFSRFVLPSSRTTG